ncbi:MAG: type 1 glutamine amidotransferase-like domain-containing protein [Candidatus Moranbacteria bacterium]|nr:type 1 glutamine amidotransferase-like domain-containing protein [Candidatus Moranbacteria bacterium]
MKLLLTSNGVSNRSIADALLALVGKSFSDSALVFVSTAANVETGDKSWLIDNLVQFRNLGFGKTDIVDIAALPKDRWMPRLEEADVIVFGGGNTSYLMDRIIRSGLKDSLPELLKSRVFVGISAGSVIACESIDKREAGSLYGEEIIGYDADEGLGYFGSIIRPHLGSEGIGMDRMEDLSERFNETFYAIDDQTAIVSDEGRIEVVSEGTWKKFERR